LSGAGILADAASSYVIFPDGTKHLLWVEVDKFGGGLVYFLVDSAKHDLDVVWLRKRGHTEYFGPNAQILQNRKLGDFLMAADFPYNPGDPFWR
jgi:hypothetical protein